MDTVILILSDGLRYDAAINGMGYLGHLVEHKLASLYKVIGELPSMSRPMYETIHTGLPVNEHGVVSNNIIRRSNQPNVFHVAVKSHKTTAAAAYAWYSELYVRAPYDPIEDREVDDELLHIQHGRYYTEDDYPDAELFNTAALLVRRFKPDYLLLHPMGMDYKGHIYGSDSKEYRNQAIIQDTLLAPLINEWMDLDYTILVTGDHGVNADHAHGGTTPEVRELPLYVIRPDVPGEGDTNQVLSQLQIAPTICKLMNLPIPDTMKHQPFV